jgi:broad specificity phosphatase PhoE
MVDKQQAYASRRIWLVRHGQTEANVERRFCGQGESALTREGREQARWLASSLSPRPLCALYSSDLRRASETAGLIAATEPRQLPIRTMAAWREIDFGAWEGLTYAEIAARFPENLGFFSDSLHCCPPGGETLEQLNQRVLEGLTHILKECESADAGEIVIVSHGGPLRLLLCNILGMPLERQWQFALEPGSLSALDLAPGQNAAPTGTLALLNMQRPGDATSKAGKL